MKQISLVTLLFLLGVGLLGCKKQTTGPEVKPQLKPTFQAATDRGEAEQIVQAIWNHLTSAECWADRGNELFQYQFYDGDRYRYNGIDVLVGGVTFLEAGTYDGHPAAMITTWTDSRELVIVLDSNSFVHSYYYMTLG